MDASNSCDSASDLVNLTSFIINNKKMLYLERRLTAAEVSVLASLLTSGAEIECLALTEELPAGTSVELSEAIKCSGSVRKLYLMYHGKEPLAPELTRLVAASASAALEVLTLWNMKTDDEHMNQLCDSFIQLATLRHIVMLYCDFSIPLFAKWISELRSLKSLSIVFDKFIPIGMLAEAITNLPVITYLALTRAGIEAKDLSKIGGLVALGRVTELNLISDELKDKGISAIVDAILTSSGKQRCSKLKKLFLNGNDIGSAGAQRIVELVTRSLHLRRLGFGSNPIGVTAIEILRKCASPLKELDIRACKLGPREIALLLASPACSALTVLNISNNEMGSLGAGAVAKLLLGSGGRTLKELHMNSNGIAEAEALELAKGLAKAYALKHIDIKGNPLGPRGAAAILDALAAASTAPMDLIDFEKCGMGDDGAEAVGRVIMCRGCRYMSLSENVIHEKGAKAIADSIDAFGFMIEALHLYKNSLCNEGVTYFLDKIMQKNRSLCELSIDLSDIGVEGAMAVNRAKEAQGALKYLSYDGNVKDKKARDILGMKEAEFDS